MMSFEGETPAWNNIPATGVTSVSEFIEGANTLLLQTDAGPVQISLYKFGARLRLGQPQIVDYGMLIEEPKAMPQAVESVDDLTVITAAGYRLKIAHKPLTF